MPHPSDSNAPLLGGRFRLHRTLGQGAFGVVHEAEDLERGGVVALKQLAVATPSALDRFKREFRLMQHVAHPNVAQVHELLKQDGDWYIVMELVQGRDWLSYVRPQADNDGSFDVGRITDTLIQIMRGLQAVHAAGLLHRDLKPSNVLVTDQGRVALLDFGLVDRTGPLEHPSLGLGSAAYMAPEQADADAVLSPAADWYAVGVLLYEALTGRLPFNGPAMQVLVDKSIHPPDPPGHLARGVPAELNVLTMQLLESNPDRRAGAKAVTAALSRSHPHQLSSTNLAPDMGASFGGRAEELSRLRDCFARSCAGEAALAIVAGPSGIGKTALLDELVRELRDQRAETVVLRGRCYEREAVPYKAFDGVVDALSRYLSRAGDEFVQQVIPRRPAAMLRLFPVLARVPALSERTLDQDFGDPVRVRRAAFESLVELFARLSERRPLVLVVDDAQWADQESFQLLRELVDGADPPSLLCALTARPRQELDGPVTEALDELRSLECCDALELDGLPFEDARILAAQLLGPDSPEERAAQIATESGGHPMFVGELVRYARDGKGRDQASLTIEAALGARLSDLEPPALRVLEVAAVAVSPVPLRVLIDAMDLGQDTVARELATLRVARLLRSDRGGRVSCSHDWVRRAVLEQIPADRLRQVHGALATRLAALDDVDRAELAAHWEASDQPQRAPEQWEAAARDASAALGFERAAELYGRVLAAREGALDEAGQARVRLAQAHVLASAGRSAEAAHGYLSCIDAAAPVDALKLRRLAAQHLLQSANIEEGLPVARELLADEGHPLPGSTMAAFFRILWHRTVIACSRAPMPTEVDANLTPQTLRRLELLFGLAPVLTWVDLYSGLELGARYTRDALASGHPLHMGLALSQEPMSLVMRGASRARVDAMMDRVMAIARVADDPRVYAAVDTTRGLMAMLEWRADEAVAHFTSGEQHLGPTSGHSAFDLALVRSFVLGAHALRADFAQAARLSERWLREAQARDDRFASSNLVLNGQAAIRHLLADRPDRAKAEVEQAAALWPDEPVGLPHFGAFGARQQVYAYEDWVETQAIAQRDSERLMKSPAASPAPLKGGILQGAALACLGAAVQLTGDERKRMARLGERTAVKLGRTFAPSRDHALMFRAEAAMLLGRRGAARDLMANVSPCAPVLDRRAEITRALIEGGAVARDRIARARQWLGEQGFVSPDRALLWLHPMSDSDV